MIPSQGSTHCLHKSNCPMLRSGELLVIWYHKDQARGSRQRRPESARCSSRRQWESQQMLGRKNVISNVQIWQKPGQKFLRSKNTAETSKLFSCSQSTLSIALPVPLSVSTIDQKLFFCPSMNGIESNCGSISNNGACRSVPLYPLGSA